MPRTRPSLDPSPLTAESLPAEAQAPTPESLELARAVRRAVEARQGEDLLILDISKVSSFADLFVLVTGDSERQVKALSDAVQEEAEKLGIRPHHVEGEAESHWILLDFVDVVVHIFLREQRVYYNIDRLWADAPRVNV